MRHRPKSCQPPCLQNGEKIQCSSLRKATAFEAFRSYSLFHVTKELKLIGGRQDGFFFLPSNDKQKRRRHVLVKGQRKRRQEISYRCLILITPSFPFLYNTGTWQHFIYRFANKPSGQPAGSISVTEAESQGGPEEL